MKAKRQVTVRKKASHHQYDASRHEYDASSYWKAEPSCLNGYKIIDAEARIVHQSCTAEVLTIWDQ
ncbi:hypothetical protein DD238_000546 [Peronospora effusa]|uniref:Uncharacterized protein n=1 Tax=Peronospora effusa TaxID=542832 RepID=A0A3M6VPH0_9STRA|nr:hypothetical protein DD238_000546 [Peronospora effusa]